MDESEKNEPKGSIMLKKPFFLLTIQMESNGIGPSTAGLTVKCSTIVPRVREHVGVKAPSKGKARPVNI